MQTALERFLRYVTYDTCSHEEFDTCPSTPGQKVFGQVLVNEMKEMGIKDAFMDDNGYVYGTVPGDPSLPTIGMIAHMDTSPDASGTNVRPKVVEFNGDDICLNEEKQIYLRMADYPHLANSIGKHLVVTDGTTLLGADDKSGVASVMTTAEGLLNSNKRHATLRIAFTPDEEIGRGPHRFDVKGFAADYAYTVDGGAIGELEFENFNAASATAVFTGLSIHPGYAKNMMINSMIPAIEFQNMLPVEQRPEFTSGYEGFIMLHSMKGEVERTTFTYIIRDHDPVKFEKKKAVMRAAANVINTKYGEGTVKLEISDMYRNMREQIEPCMYIIDRAKAAMERVGVKPVIVPIRGGTDGAQLSFMGLPCPNIFAGGENAHGRFEYLPVEDLEKSVEVLTEILTGF